MEASGSASGTIVDNRTINQAHHQAPFLCRLTYRNVAGVAGDPLFGEEGFEGQKQEFAPQLAAVAAAQDREAQVGRIFTPSKRRERTRGSCKVPDDRSPSRRLVRRCSAYVVWLPVRT